MENSLIESVLNVCKILNNHSVEYLIVGGTAVALHGYYRQSHTSSGRLAENMILISGIIQLMTIILGFSMP